MQEVIQRAELVAQTKSTVLITGETGTGKEMVARAIHHRSAQRDMPLIKVNCAAIPETLLESELFGHVRGAFTGATMTKRGKFALADGGSIFLDEIGTLTTSIQAKLLRVLQEREFEPLGAERTQRVEVRVIAATNRDLKQMVSEGKFLEDLYYRLNVIPVEMPPLRARKDDIPRLVEHFIAVFCHENGKPLKRVDGEALAYFLAYDWPGNVRELRNMVERLVIMAPRATIAPEDLPPPLRAQDFDATAAGAARSLREARDAFERAFILAELRVHDWNMTRTAERLGIERSHLYRKIRAYGITIPK